MQTQCRSRQFEFEGVAGRKVVAGFDGGAMTTDAVALLLRHADNAIGLFVRVAGCFTDQRNSDFTVHSLRTLIAQRVTAIALGYEDVEDHDTLRHDPVLGLVAGELDPEALRLCAAGRQVDLEPAGACPGRGTCRRADAL